MSETAYESHAVETVQPQNNSDNGDVVAASPTSQNRGAPRSNRNAVSHGMRMVSGRLPQGASWIRRETDSLKRRLEDVVVNIKGELSPMDVATVNEVVTWERHRLLASRWLRLSCDDMNHDQRLSYSREVAKSASERNRALRLLGIDKGQQGAWTFDLPELPEKAMNAPESVTGAQEANHGEA